MRLWLSGPRLFGGLVMAIAAFMAMRVAAHAEQHHEITDTELSNCLSLGHDQDDTLWCAKSTKGMSQAEIDAWKQANIEPGCEEAKLDPEVCIRWSEGMTQAQKDAWWADRESHWNGTPNGADEIAYFKECMVSMPNSGRPAELAAKDKETCLWHIKFDDCLMMDNRGLNHDGDEFCIKHGRGMTQAQKDEWIAEYTKHAEADEAKQAAPDYKNCMRELDAFNSRGGWTGPPSVEDCHRFGEALRQKGIDMLNDAFKAMMDDAK